MSTRKVTAEYRRAQWAQIISERMKSGEKVDAFCEARGIARHQYFYWLRKLRDAACTEMLAAKPEAPVKPTALSGWVICEAAENARKASVDVEIGKCRVNVAPDTNLELLGEVCKVLVAIC